jgi:hypothetical protein
MHTLLRKDTSTEQSVANQKNDYLNSSSRFISIYFSQMLVSKPARQGDGHQEQWLFQHNSSINYEL